MDSFSEFAPALAATLWLAAAAAVDQMRHRIPNPLAVSGALLGLALQCWLQGWAGLSDGLAGFAAGLLLFLPLYAFGWMGGGDVKLMAAAGVFAGWPGSLLAVSLSAGIGASAALVLIGVRGGMVEYLNRWGHMARCLIGTGRVYYVPPPPGSAASQSFPYAFAIALGTLAALWWLGRFDPWLRLLGV
jgi:prepilin peptidase CpaA